MTILLLPHQRAPFIAPGRRNRKVHWNRALTKAIEQLGNYEREDWRRSQWLPQSLRPFYPKWNMFTPGCTDGGCCDGVSLCDGCNGSALGDWEYTLAGAVNATCSNCVNFNGTYITNIAFGCQTNTIFPGAHCIPDPLQINASVIPHIGGVPGRVWVQHTCESTSVSFRYIRFARDFSPVLNCDDIIGENIPYSANTFGSECDLTGMTCILTKL